MAEGPVNAATRWLAAHRKVIVAVTGAAVTVAVQVWGTSNYWVSLAVLTATSLGVYGAPNTQPAAPRTARQPDEPTGNVKVIDPETGAVKTVDPGPPTRP
jgi:hypothetical protein